MFDIVRLVPDTLVGKRDRALLLFAFASACRRSEISALQVGDVSKVPEGLRVLTRRSKADQEGAGAEIATPRGRRACLVPREWLASAPDSRPR